MQSICPCIITICKFFCFWKQNLCQYSFRLCSTDKVGRCRLLVFVLRGRKFSSFVCLHFMPAKRRQGHSPAFFWSVSGLVMASKNVRHKPVKTYAARMRSPNATGKTLVQIWRRMRCMASMQSSRLPNAVRRRYPSPLGPNPTPGVPTIFIL